MRLNATLFASAAIAVGVLAVSTHSFAQDKGSASVAGQEKAAYQLQIPVAPLADALNQFGVQTGYQVVYKRELVMGLQSKAVSGKLTVDSAMDALLKGTGLVWSRAGNTVVVKKATDVPVAMVAVGGKDALANDSEVAEKTPVEQMVVEGQRDKSKPFSTPNLDLTRTEDDALPFQVFTAKEIELSGSLDLREFLQKRLPQNFTNNNDTLFDATGTGPLNDAIDLRGWGSKETLLLLNGRRMGEENQALNDDTGLKLASLRAIPMASIERIEILSSAAGAIYGASATGGVINIITRQDFSGGQVSLNYQTPTDVLRPQRSMNLSYGHGLRPGLSARLTAGYSDSEPMRVGDRADESILRWRRLAMERNPAALINSVGGNPFVTSTQDLYGATPNIRTTSTAASANLFTNLSGSQASNFTTVPDGYTGPDSSTPNRLAAFQPGRYNTELADASGSRYGLGSFTGPSAENVSASAGLDWSISKDWRWSLGYDHRATRSEGYPATDLSFTNSSSVSKAPRVPAAAPGNPFGQNVQVYLIDPNLYLPELGSRARSTTSTLSSTLRGQMGRWSGFLDLSASRNTVLTDNTQFYEPTGGWTAAFLSGAYNPFVDTRVRAPASAAFYADYVQQKSRFTDKTSNYGAMLKASGPLIDLPAGAVQLTAGADWSRSKRGTSDFEQEFFSSISGAAVAPVGGTASSDSNKLVFNAQNARQSDSSSLAAYGEAVVPLLSSRQAIPLVKHLEVFAAGRLSRNENSGYAQGDFVTVTRAALIAAGIPEELLPPVAPLPEGSYNTDTTLFTVGLRHEILDGITWRLSRSQGFLPPTLAQITESDPDRLLAQLIETIAPSPPPVYSDPIRGGTFALLPTMYLSGGNPDLKPETTESTNVGLILQPHWIPGLRLSIDYVENVRNDAIFSLTAQQALDLELELPGVVQRGAPDGNASGVGPITLLDQRYRNLRSITSRSVDFSLSQEIGDVGGGQLFLNLAATRNLSFKVQTTNTSAPTEHVHSRGSSFSQQIAWNGNAQVNWQGPHWGFGWNTRYLDYLLVSTTNNMLLQGDDRAPRDFEHDLNLSYRVPAAGDARGWRELLSGVSFTLVVKNVFDRAPRFWAASTEGIAPFDASALSGRTMSLQMSKNFGN